jgi:ubiquinone biosynthesis protein COQ9
MPAPQRLPRSLRSLTTRIPRCEHHEALACRRFLIAGQRSYNTTPTTPRHTSRPLRSSPRTLRTYYTASTPEPNPFPAAEEAILSAALQYVPIHGFTAKSLTLGAVDTGYLPSSVNLFPSGAFDLVRYHLITQRLHLKNAVQFPTPVSNPTPQGPGPRDPGDTTRLLGVGAKVRALVLARLHANEPIIEQLPEALGLMSLAGNIPASTAELGRLVDEMWYLAGDVSVDTSWYTKRGLLTGVYASAEVFQSQDTSLDFKETEKFVDRRLQDVLTVGGAAGAVTEWVGYTAMSAVNVARSLGVRI